MSTTMNVFPLHGMRCPMATTRPSITATRLVPAMDVPCTQISVAEEETGKTISRGTVVRSAFHDRRVDAIVGENHPTAPSSNKIMSTGDFRRKDPDTGKNTMISTTPA